MRTQIISVAAAACFALSLGCPAAGGGGAGGKSPEATFKTLQAAAEKEDQKALFECMDPEAHDSVLFGMTIAAGFMTFGKDEATKKAIEDELDGISKKHGVVELDKNEVKMNDKAGMEAAAKKMFANVKDKPAMFADLSGLVEKHADKKGGSKKQYTDGTLEDVKVEGDSATATFKKTDGTTQPVKFVNREGKWYVGV